MDFINNRYRILKNIRQNRLISSYLAADMKKNFKAVQLNIINSEYLPDKLLDYYIKEFMTLTTIEDKNIVKLYDFDIIKTIDNKRIDNRQYFYVNENFEANNSFIDTIKYLDYDKILDLFVEICQSINYLHLRNFVYGDININNIYIDGLNIKLKDIATLKLESYYHWNSKENELIFKAPEVIAEEKFSVSSDIYSLGVLLLFMCQKENKENNNILNQVIKLKNLKDNYKSFSKNNVLFLEKISTIVQKMIESDVNKRYKSINEVIKDINKIFNKNYKPHNKKQLEKLNFKTKLVGREYEINAIFNMYNSIERMQFSKNLAIVHGESGIGKTKFLREIEYIFSMKNVNVYSNFISDNINFFKNKAFLEILKTIIDECEAETFKRYESELVKFIPSLEDKNNNNVFVDYLLDSKEKIKVLNTISSFISDFIKGKPAIFIMDNLHMASEFSIDILEYMHLRNPNIMFIVSYCDGEVTYNKRLVQFLSKTANKSNVLDIQLRGLNKKDSIDMIQDILRSPIKLENFGGRIFSKTYGNPLFIVETLKNLFAEKILYIDEDSGNWINKYDYDYNKMPVPSNMEQAVLAQIKGIDELSLNILNIVSIFNTGISLETLNNIIQNDKKVVEQHIEDLEGRGILCQKIEDSGFVYDFSNKILKMLIEKKIEKDYKKNIHKLAANLLEKQYINESVNSEEFIYHLEKSDQKEKIIKYCLENADKMENYKNRIDAVKNLKKVISIMEDELSPRKIKILFRIGRIYEELGNWTNSIEYYNEAENLAREIKDNIYEIQAINKIANIFLYKNDTLKALNYIEKAEKIIYSSDFLNKYTEEYLEYKEIQVRLYYITQKYKEIEEICKNCIELCGEKYNKLKGLFYKNLGNYYLHKGNIEQALNYYNESKICFEKSQYNEGIATILNNIAVVYEDYYQDNEKSMEYILNTIDICEKNHIVVLEVVALTNLASFYYDSWNYDLALQYFLEAVEKGKSIELESNIFYCYNYLSNIYLNTGEYKKAYEYFLLAQKELEDYPEQGKDIGLYYKMGAELLYSFGDNEKAKEYILKALDIYKDSKAIQKWESLVLYQYIDICIKEEENSVIENIDIIKNIISNFKNPLKKLDILCNTAILLYKKGFIKLTEIVFKETKNIKVDYITNRIRAMILFLTGILRKNRNKLKYLNLALDIIKKEREKVLHSNICCALGDYYLLKKDYFYAANYYFEASEIIKSATLQIPDEFKVKFMNMPGTINSFIMLMNMRKANNYDALFNHKGNKLLIKGIKELNVLFDYEEFGEILTNKDFIRSAKKIYSSSLPKGIRGVKDIIKNLYSDPLKNLDIIAKYLASVTLATRSLILVDDYDQNYYAIASNDGNNQVPLSKYLLETVRVLKEPILITENLIDDNNSNFVHILQGKKAVICIPIIMNSQDMNFNLKENKRKNSFTNKFIKGYIYLESDRTLNNFNKEGLKKCIEVSRLAGFIIEKYQFQISSSMDKLTGALTRKALEDALTEHIDLTDEINGKFSIIMVDLDLFKHINDRFGHQTGDEVLRKVCSIIKNNIRKDDIFGRYGGEEFIIVLPQTDSKDALAVAEKLREKIEKAKILGDNIPVTVSMGIASYPEHAKWKQEIIEKADQALYVSKELGRNQCNVWSNKFSTKVKGTDKLTGIVSGNTVQDSRNVLAMLDIIEIIKKEDIIENKIFNYLGRIIEITESDYGVFFLVENKRIKKEYARKVFEEKWEEIYSYNLDAINSVIDNKQGVYMLDWDENLKYDSITGIPEWNSICVVPLIKNGDIKGVLYLSVSTKKKEFKFEEFNFISTLGDLGSLML